MIIDLLVDPNSEWLSRTTIAVKQLWTQSSTKTLNFLLRT